MRNIAAKNLGTARYRKQVVRNRKAYNRKAKHSKGD